MTSEPLIDLDEIILTYLRSIDAGLAPNPAEWLARYPLHAATLESFFYCESHLALAGTCTVGLLTEGAVSSDSNPGDDHVTTAGRFQLGATLGRGGMGDVRRAQDPVLDREVAVKLMQSRHHGSSQLARRFLAEAKITAGLQHPGIPPVHEMGEAADGRPFIAMKLIEGKTLAELLAHRAAPTDDLPHFLKIFEQIAQTVAYAHSRGIVHRDLKPHNVMVGEFGEVQVMDWGLAKRLDVRDKRDDLPPRPSEPSGDALAATSLGDIIGTPRYLPPEQAQGEVSAIDSRSDVFGLGAILLEILTGLPPYGGDDPLGWARAGNLVDAHNRLVASGADPELVSLTRDCLALRPDDRPPNGQAVVERISSHLTGVQVRLRNVELAAAKSLEARRGRRLVVGLLTLVALASVGVSLWLNHERRKALHAESLAIQSDQGRLQELYRAYLRESVASRLLGQVGQREIGLAAIRKVLATVPREQLSDAQLAELRAEALACLCLDDLREIRRLPVPSRYDFDVDVDESFESVLHLGQRPADTYITTLETSQRTLELPASTSSFSVMNVFRKFSPTGRFVVEVVTRATNERAKNQFRIYDRETGRFTHDQPVTTYTLPAFYPDGRRVILRDSDSSLHEYDLESGKLLRQSPLGFGSVMISPDGKLAAVAGVAQPPRIIRLEDWQTLHVFPEVADTTTVAWSPDQLTVVWSTRSGDLWQWNFVSKVGHFLPIHRRHPVEALGFSPDGRLLAATHADGRCLLLRVHDERELFSLPGRFLRFSLDGRRIAVDAEGQLVIYERTGDRSLVTSRFPGKYVEYSPGGDLLAISGDFGAVIVEPDELRFRADLQLDNCGPIAFHPSNRELLTYGRFTKVYRWPIAAPDDQHPKWRIGPAKPLVPVNPLSSLLVEPQHFGRFVQWSPSGSFLYYADCRRNQMWMQGEGEQTPHVFVPQNAPDQIAISRDEDWIAVASILPTDCVRIWNKARSEKVFEIPGHARALFSHDGRFLITASRDEVHFYSVGDWRRQRIFSHPNTSSWRVTALAAQSNGSLLAYCDRPGNVRLVNWSTGREVAKLHFPEAANVHWLSFSSDGSQLAFASMTVVGRWNLASLRAGLEELGLAEDELPRVAATVPERLVEVQRGDVLPPPIQWAQDWLTLAQWETANGEHNDAVNAANEAVAILRFDATNQQRADVYATRGRYYYRNGNRHAAIADWQRAIDLIPLHPEASRRLAQAHLFAPSESRAPRLAQALLTPLVSPKSHDNDILGLIGVAELRLGQYAEALARLPAGSDSELTPILSWYRVLVLHRLGDSSAANAALTFARQQSENGSFYFDSAEFERIRAEVELAMQGK